MSTIYIITMSFPIGKIRNEEVYLMMAQGLFGILMLMIYVVLIFGSIAAVVFFILAAWKAMRAHESIAESIKVIAEAQAKTAARGTENKETN